MRPDQVKLIAKRLGVGEQDVIDMNRRFGGDASLNTPIREDGDSGEWQDWLMDESPDQETTLAAEILKYARGKRLTSFHFSNIPILFSIFAPIVLCLGRRNLMVRHRLW